jgi:hypothetical protein
MILITLRMSPSLAPRSAAGFNDFFGPHRTILQHSPKQTRESTLDTSAVCLTLRITSLLVVARRHRRSISRPWSE